MKTQTIMLKMDHCHTNIFGTILDNTKMSQGCFNFEAVQVPLCFKDSDHFQGFIQLVCKVPSCRKLHFPSLPR